MASNSPTDGTQSRDEEANILRHIQQCLLASRAPGALVTHLKSILQTGAAAPGSTNSPQDRSTKEHSKDNSSSKSDALTTPHKQTQTGGPSSTDPASEKRKASPGDTSSVKKIRSGDERDWLDSINADPEGSPGVAALGHSFSGGMILGFQQMENSPRGSGRGKRNRGRGRGRARGG